MPPLALTLPSLASETAVPSPALVIPDGWTPAGWKVGPTEEVAGYDMVQSMATVVEDGRPIASLVAFIVRENGQKSLPAALKDITDQEVIKGGQRGALTSVSPAVAVTWAGHPALRADIIFTVSSRNLHQQAFMTQAPGNVTCVLIYSAGEANFATYSAAAEQARDAIPCH